MGSRYVLTDETLKRDLIDCSGRAAQHLLDLMDQAGQAFTLVSDCSFFGHDGNPLTETPVHYDARTVIAELNALLERLSTTTLDLEKTGLSQAEWQDWIRRTRDHAAASPGHRFTAAYYT